MAVEEWIRYWPVVVDGIAKDKSVFMEGCAKDCIIIVHHQTDNSGPKLYIFA
jgi:hypothetical protein